MTLDNVPFCYKEYPPVPEMQCEGHKTKIRWASMIPGILTGIMVVGFIIGLLYGGAV